MENLSPSGGSEPAAPRPDPVASHRIAIPLALVAVVALVAGGYLLLRDRSAMSSPVNVPAMNAKDQVFTHYASRNGAIYFDSADPTSDQAIKVEGADSSTFTELAAAEDGAAWAHDVAHVFVDGQMVPFSVDPASFSVVRGDIFKDKSGVYLAQRPDPDQSSLYFFQIPGADPSSFVYVGTAKDDGTEDYFKDAKHVYQSGVVNDRMDAASFVIVTGMSNDGMLAFGKDKDHVFWHNGTIIKGADPAKCVAERIKDCNPSNQWPPEMDEPIFIDVSSVKHFGYRTANGAVYYNDRKIDADPASLQVVVTDPRNNNWAIDKKHVYVMGYRVSFLNDPTSFTLIDRTLIKDKNGVYVMIDNPDQVYGAPSFFQIPGADPMTFKSSGLVAAVEKSRSSYYVDANHVYIDGYILPGADAASFEYLDMYSDYDDGMPWAMSYAKDAHRVYFSGAPSDADAATFIDFKDGYARDKNTVYFLGQPVADESDDGSHVIDPSNFVTLGRGYAKTAKAIFWAGRQVHDADPVTFSLVEGTRYAKDKSHVYDQYARILEGADPKECSEKNAKACEGVVIQNDNF